MSTLKIQLLLLSTMILGGCTTPPPIESAEFDDLVRTSIELHGQKIIFKSRSIQNVNDIEQVFLSTETEILLLQWQPYKSRYQETARIPYASISSVSLESQWFHKFLVIKRKRGSVLVVTPIAGTLSLFSHQSNSVALHARINEQLEKVRHLAKPENIEVVLIGVADVQSPADVRLDVDELGRGLAARSVSERIC